MAGRGITRRLVSWLLAAAVAVAAGCGRHGQDESRIRGLEGEIEDLTDRLERSERELARERDERRAEQEQWRQERARAGEQTGRHDARIAELQVELARLRESLEQARRNPVPPAVPPPAPVPPVGPPVGPPVAVKSGDVVAQHLMDCVVVIEGDRSSGTGFLAGSGDKTYLYTAAHVLSGNSKLTVRNSSGRRFARFGNLEAAEGADLVRMALVGEEIPAKLELVAPDAPLPPGTRVMVLGNGGGAGVVVVETGKVLGQSGESLEVDAGVIQGNSGGPVIELAGGRAVGVITHLTAERRDIWSRGSRLGEVRRFACRLNREWQWQRSTVPVFLGEAQKIEEYDRLTKLAMAIGALTPGVEGLRLDQAMSRDVTVLAIFNESKDLPVVAELMAMNQELAEKRMRLSEADLKKRFRGVIGAALNLLRQNGNGFTPARFSWFHRQRAEESVTWRGKAEVQLRARQQELR